MAVCIISIKSLNSNTRKLFPVNNRTVLSSLPVRIYRPSGENTADVAAPLWVPRVRLLLFLKSHNCTAPSFPAITINCPSGENEAVLKLAASPLNGSRTWFPFKSQSRTASQPADTIYCPSWEKETEFTTPVCPAKVATVFPVRSNRRIYLSRQAATIMF